MQMPGTLSVLGILLNEPNEYFNYVKTLIVLHMKLKFKLTSTREDSNGLTLTYRNGYIFTEVTITEEARIEMTKEHLREGHLKSTEFEVVFRPVIVDGEAEIVALICRTSTDPDTSDVAWASGWSPDERLVQLQYGDIMRY